MASPGKGLPCLPGFSAPPVVRRVGRRAGLPTVRPCAMPLDARAALRCSIGQRADRRLLSAANRRRQRRRRRRPQPPPCFVLVQPQANYAKKQTLGYKNGYAVPVELGTPSEEDLRQQLANWSIAAAPAAASTAPAEPFVPAFVALDKKAREGGAGAWGGGGTRRAACLKAGAACVSASAP